MRCVAREPGNRVLHSREVYDRGNGGGLEEEQEEIEVLEIAYERALGMVRTGEIRDAKTIMLLQYMRVEGVL